MFSKAARVAHCKWAKGCLKMHRPIASSQGFMARLTTHVLNNHHIQDVVQAPLTALSRRALGLLQLNGFHSIQLEGCGDDDDRSHGPQSID